EGALVRGGDPGHGFGQHVQRLVVDYLCSPLDFPPAHRTCPFAALTVVSRRVPTFSGVHVDLILWFQLHAVRIVYRSIAKVLVRSTSVSKQAKEVRLTMILVSKQVVVNDVSIWDLAKKEHLVRSEARKFWRSFSVPCNAPPAIHITNAFSNVENDLDA